MEIKVKSKCETQQSEDEMGIRKGPWTVEEDAILVNHIATHGEGRWNSVARCAGLKRTGKSCRLRWLNYLRPDVRRGNITLQEQILILDLHSRWGNRWSKIAQQLPGRTDNEIKNYWRTRVMKQAKQLKCDVNSKQFRDAMRYVWMPRLLERIRAAASEYNPICQPTASTPHLHPTSPTGHWPNPNYSEGTGLQLPLTLDPPDSPGFPGLNQASDGSGNGSGLCPRVVGSNNQALYLEQGNTLGGGGEWLEGLWNDENIWFLRQQLFEDL